MFVRNRKRITINFLIVISLGWTCRARSESYLSETATKFEDLSNASKVENQSHYVNLGNSHIVEGISVGIENAVAECKKQFQWDLWNCPVEPSSLLTKASVYKGTREAAYLQAVTAAGIMYYVTKECSHPNNTACSCSSKKRKYMNTTGHGTTDWEWQGCMRNVRFGEKVSRTFLGTYEEGSISIIATKRHNERAGREAVKSSLQNMCKCHGPTRSCTFKTCWKVLPGFSVIAHDLRERYQMSWNTKHLRTRNEAGKLPRYKKVSKRELVYSEDSPNYCVPDNTIGYLGTKGRECRRLEKGDNKSTMPFWERTSCRRLCQHCGHQVRGYPRTQTFDCGCTFHWCCAIECKQCQKKVWRYFCN